MNKIEELLKKPTSEIETKEEGFFDKFDLTENPFPSTPVINKDSADDRINGNIFEMAIREKENEQIEKNFLQVPQANPNHIRLGYIIDTSFTGRGNGKSAFIININKKINLNFCMDISNDKNKCFSVYVSPDSSGRSKTFANFIDQIFSAMISSNIINTCLALLRLDAIKKLNLLNEDLLEEFNKSNYVELLNSEEWFKKKSLDITRINKEISKNEYLTKLPSGFPGLHRFVFPEVANDSEFTKYYSEIKGTKEKNDFMFSHLVDFFRAASFNGAYIFIDDFERIPDFQSARLKRDFAIELRRCLFDGPYSNARIGFYNFILVLHAGVPRLIQEAWSESGMANRSPIFAPIDSKHIIVFEKITASHVNLLIKTYLDKYRKSKKHKGTYPFDEDVIAKIAEISDRNAATILQIAYQLLDRVAIETDIKKIDMTVFNSYQTSLNINKNHENIAKIETTDLHEKADRDS